MLRKIIQLLMNPEFVLPVERLLLKACMGIISLISFGIVLIALNFSALCAEAPDKEIIDACQQIIDAVELLNFKSEELY